MKTIIYIIFGLFFTSFLYSQSSFEYLYSTPYDELTLNLAEDLDGNIYFPVINFEHALIIKIDQNGLFVDSISIYNQGGYCFLETLIKVDSTHFVALGNWTTDSVSQLWFIKFNTDLAIIKDVKLNSNDWLISDFQCIINGKGNIVFSAGYIPPQTEVDVCLYEITLEGNLVRNRFFESPFSFNIATAILADYENSSYKVISTGPLDTLSDRLFCIINIVDTNFNLIDEGSVHNPYFNTRASAKWVNDSTYLLAGKWLIISEDEWDLGILKMTREDSILSSASYGKSDTVDWPANYKCLDFISPNNIFFAGSSNSYTIHFQNEPSQIMLNILDSNLNIKHQQFFGGDAYYLVKAVIATNDSGCVMACTRYDYRIQYNESDVYILKVNKDGLLVSIPENPVINTNSCYLYPNPGSEQLNVNCPFDGLGIQLFDLIGRIKMTARLGAGSNSIPLDGLSAGIYLYKITNWRSQIVQSGKWIKR